MTLKEKISELYDTLKPVCTERGLCHPWEVHKALRRFISKNPEYGREWFGE